MFNLIPTAARSHRLYVVATWPFVVQSSMGQIPQLRRGRKLMVPHVCECAGDSATEEAHYLTKYARHVHLLVRKDRMRASKTMQDRVLQHPNITVHYSTNVVDAFGDADGLKGLELVDSKTGDTRKIELRGLFYGIGHTPNSKLVADQVGFLRNWHQNAAAVCFVTT